MTLVGAIACKMLQNLSSCNPPRATKRFVSLLITFLLDGQHTRQLISVTCNSDSEMLGALQTVETVVRTQIHRLDADRIPMFLIGWTWQGFCRDFGSLLVWVADCHYDVTRWPSFLFVTTSGIGFARSMADSWCHRSFFSCKDNTLIV